MNDKMKHKAEELGGKAKEKVGDATGDQDMKAEGQAESTKGSLKGAGDKAKDAFSG